MRPATLIAGTLVAAAALVLVLKTYATLDSASVAAAFQGVDEPGVAGALRASGIADAIRDAGILLALAGVVFALDRRRL